MSMGWDLPPGAAGDPRAPWNERECRDCGATYARCDDHECDEDEEPDAEP